MQEVVGKCFRVETIEFVVVDVRNIDGEVMVYADRAGLPNGPGRAAFRLSDVEGKLADSAAA